MAAKSKPAEPVKKKKGWQGPGPGRKRLGSKHAFTSERARFEHPAQRMFPPSIMNSHGSVSHLAEMRSTQRAIAIMSGAGGQAHDFVAAG